MIYEYFSVRGGSRDAREVATAAAKHFGRPGHLGSWGGSRTRGGADADRSKALRHRPLDSSRPQNAATLWKTAQTPRGRCLEFGQRRESIDTLPAIFAIHTQC